MTNSAKNWFVQYFDYFFLALALIELAFVVSFPPGRYITKPLIMISLLVYYISSAYKTDRLFVLAIIFAWLGDTFLLFEGYFLYGLGSFLIMQILYAICFLLQRGKATAIKLAGIVLTLLSTSIVLYYLLPALATELKLPIAIYSGAISLMAITAIARVNNGIHYLLILVGVLCFVISDTILGLNQFYSAIPLGGLAVMFTYITAQYLIIRGYLNYSNSNNA